MNTVSGKLFITYSVGKIVALIDKRIGAILKSQFKVYFFSVILTDYQSGVNNFVTEFFDFQILTDDFLVIFNAV
ncbi:hypothetical protein D3C73_1232100 [compost metagenome]